MCGVAGIISTGELSAEHERAARRLLSELGKRGPDGAGMHQEKSAILIQTLLSFEGNPGQLPHRSADRRYFIVFNGEIYNFRELRSELQREFSFQTRTDTEVLLAAWIKWGKGCLHRLRGMYAFFIWDTKTQTGFAARDPLGVKPFFYAATEDLFAFSSEAGSLIRSGLRPFVPQEDELLLYLTAPYFSGARATPFTGIFPLLPGECLEVGGGKVHKESYFSYGFRPGHFEPSQLESVLKGAVRDCLQTREKLGLFLSGGLDSALIAAFSSSELGSLPPSFTIDFPENENSDFNEPLILKSRDLPYAVKTARHLGGEVRTIEVRLDSFRAHLRRTLSTNDLICAWEQEVSQNILSQEAAKSVKGILNGDAADETHFGYGFLLTDHMIRTPQNILDWFGTVPLKQKHAGTLTRDLLQRHAKEKGHSWETRDSRILATSRLVLDFWLPRLLHNGDCHTMAHSLEARVPFAHPEVLKHSQLVTPAISFGDGIEKSHLRQLAGKYLPPEVAWRPKSALTKSLAGRKVIHEEFCRVWNESGELLSPYVDMDAVHTWTRPPSTSLTDQQTGLEFRILSLLSWFRRFS